MMTDEAGLLRERLDAALHEWWDDDHGKGVVHSCRPVPSETEFIEITARHGVALALAQVPAQEERLREVDGEPCRFVDIPRPYCSVHGGWWVYGYCDRAPLRALGDESKEEHDLPLHRP